MSGDRRRHVLIADDDASIRRMLTVSLERQGYRTSGARDGVETLETMSFACPLMLHSLYAWRAR